jgi:hypothetical protein
MDKSWAIYIIDAKETLTITAVGPNLADNPNFQKVLDSVAKWEPPATPKPSPSKAKPP